MVQAHLEAQKRVTSFTCDSFCSVSYTHLLGTTGTHGGERLVTWSIKEGYLATAFQGHTIGTDMLGLSLIHIFDAKNSKNVTVNDKTYKKIDEKGITLDF